VESLMPQVLSAAVVFGGYISVVKLVIFLLFFFAWPPLLGWVHNDAKSVSANVPAWTWAVFGAGAVGLIAWTQIPLFAVGLAIYTLLVAGVSLAYVKHRNARVMDFDRVLTAEHLKSLFVGKKKKLEALHSFVFITANKNEVPVPEPRTPEFFGYKMAYDLFNDALWRRATTVMLGPGPQEYRVIYSIDGVTSKQPDIPKDQVDYLIRFLKHLGDLDIKEKRKPQKGHFWVLKEEKNTEWEIVTAGSTAGEQVKLKRVEEGTLRLSDLGFTNGQLEQLNGFRQLKQGLFIISGPKKSGVTTTFYALLRNHDAFLNSISTLEKQPSADIPNITQEVFHITEGGPSSYGEKLQEIVRMGSDIIGVADCDDPETAQTACKAATDAKLVYVTLEADSVVQALAKWLKMVPDRELVAQTLLGISNQRLLRKLCDECKQAYAPNKELFRKFNLNAEKTKVLYREGKVQYDKHGKPITCENCQGTGFVGRTGVFEMIILDDNLRDVLRHTKPLSEIAHQFRRAKMLYLQEQALRKVIAGVTSVNEMIRVLSAPKKKKAS